MASALTLEKFKSAEKQSAGQTYPVYVNNLAAAGVRSYSVDVSTQDRRVFGNSHDHILNIPGNAPPLACAEKFDLVKLKEALHRSQTGQINYPTFMQEIAIAGVQFYVADIANRKVSYYGRLATDVYEEMVPNT